MIDRERRRKAMYGTMCYHRAAGHASVAAAIAKQLRAWPIGGMFPEEPRPLVTHCGEWYVVENVPLVMPCCGVVLFSA